MHCCIFCSLEKTRFWKNSILFYFPNCCLINLMIKSRSLKMKTRQKKGLCPFFFSAEFLTETRCSVIALSICFLEDFFLKSSSLNLCNNTSVKLLLWVFASVVFVYAGVRWSLLVSLVTSFQKIKYLLGAIRLLPVIRLPTVNSAISPQILRQLR